jgi:hypothetical protein
MSVTLRMRVLTGAVAVGAAGLALGADTFSGYLCCNMRSDGSWISDINYTGSGMTVIPAGTPVKVLGYGHYRVKVEIAGKKQAIGNDYSRDLPLDVFAKRYVVADNPADKLSQYPERVRTAITSARLVKGMTREQVLMSVGYPVSSENAHLEDKVWRFWLSSFAEFRVKFDDQQRVSDVEGDPDTRDKVLLQ